MGPKPGQVGLPRQPAGLGRQALFALCGPRLQDSKTRSLDTDHAQGTCVDRKRSGCTWHFQVNKQQGNSGFLLQEVTLPKPSKARPPSESAGGHGPAASPERTYATLYEISCWRMSDPVRESRLR